MNYHLCMSQFKTSVILCIQNFAKNDTENAELASKMLRQQHFLHQRKNLYTKNLYEVFQARQNQRILTKIFRLLSPFLLPIHPRTLSELVWRRSGWDGDRLGRFAPPRSRLSKPAPPGRRLPRYNKGGKKRDSGYEDFRSGNFWRNLW